ncbi:MAG: bifunctional oligoribonuclease/PAP phosphatase NrnA, partial [Candidatus Gracilibacteria bacterium]
MNIPISERLKTEFRKAKKVLIEAERVCIISHRSPDADAIASNLALRFCLEKYGKNVISACVDPVGPECLFMKDSDKFVTDFNYEDFDVIVSVDCGALKLVKFPEIKPEILSGTKPFINFDHHESNDFYGTINPVDADACATAFIIFQFLNFCEIPISIDIATCLLAGIYFDTGSLMHSNTTPDVYYVAGRLVALGADLKLISKNLFHTTPVNKLRLWGRILERTYVNEDGVTISAVGSADYEQVGASSKDTGGVIDFLNAVPGSKYCVLLSEDEKGFVKGSLRTQRDDVNLSEVASQWGGGGHPKASGFGISGHLKPV